MYTLEGANTSVYIDRDDARVVHVVALFNNFFNALLTMFDVRWTKNSTSINLPVVRNLDLSRLRLLYFCETLPLNET
jgi:hypothetical protein